MPYAHALGICAERDLTDFLDQQSLEGWDVVAVMPTMIKPRPDMVIAAGHTPYQGPGFACLVRKPRDIVVTQPVDDPKTDIMVSALVRPKE